MPSQETAAWRTELCTLGRTVSAANTLSAENSRVGLGSLQNFPCWWKDPVGFRLQRLPLYRISLSVLVFYFCYCLLCPHLSLSLSLSVSLNMLLAMYIWQISLTDWVWAVAIYHSTCPESVQPSDSLSLLASSCQYFPCMAQTALDLPSSQIRYIRIWYFASLTNTPVSTNW